MMIHKLKIAPEYFTAVADKMKTFEVRKDDRPFSVYDLLQLCEWVNDHYTGREIMVRVTYILRNTDKAQYCAEGYCILAIRKVELRGT